MKHISVVIKEMMDKGTIPPSQKVSRYKPKITILETKALLFKLFAESGQMDETVLYICQLIGEALKYIEHELTGLIPVRDAVSCINGIIYLLSGDEALAEYIAMQFLKAFIDLDLEEAVSFYEKQKNILLKEQD